MNEVSLTVEVPEDAVLHAGIGIVSWLDGEDGSLRFGVASMGEVPGSTLLGLLRIADNAVIRAMTEGQ